jgi:hypothetical protein
VNAADRTFQVLLRMYPADFRAEYGREMTLAFGDLRRQRDEAHGARFWVHLLWDVGKSAPALRVEAFRARWEISIQTQEGKMKLRIMGILTILIGAFEAASALIEGWGSGGVVNRDAYSLIWGTFGAIAGTLLLSSGVALIRKSPGAPTFSYIAATTCFAVFALLTIIQPRMSIMATLLGIGFPIALTLFLYWTQGRGQSATTAA